MKNVTEKTVQDLIDAATLSLRALKRSRAFNCDGSYQKEVAALEAALEAIHTPRVIDDSLEGFMTVEQMIYGKGKTK